MSSQANSNVEVMVKYPSYLWAKAFAHSDIHNSEAAWVSTDIRPTLFHGQTYLSHKNTFNCRLCHPNDGNQEFIEKFLAQ